MLIIDGDAVSAEMLRTRLTNEGFSVTTPETNEELPTVIDRSDPDLVLIDWDLPGVVTLQLMRHVAELAEQRRSVRVLALSAYASEQQVVAGLEQGLDDYVAKPYSLPELLARVRALLRSGLRPQLESDLLEFHGLRLDLADVRATLHDRRVHLRGTEFRLLECLMRHPERAFSRQQLLLHAWGRGSTADERAVDVTIQRIRRALEPHQWCAHVQTIRSFGYRLSATPE